MAIGVLAQGTVPVSTTTTVYTPGAGLYVVAEILISATNTAARTVSVRVDNTVIYNNFSIPATETFRRRFLLGAGHELVVINHSTSGDGVNYVVMGNEKTV